MKISKKMLMVLGVGVFIIAVVMLFMSYSKQTALEIVAQETLNSTSANLTKVSAEKTNQDKLLAQSKSKVAQLQGQLTQLNNQLANKQEVLPSSINDLDYGELLFKMARSLDIAVNSLNLQEPSVIKIQNLSFNITQINISVTGNTSDIIALVNAIATQEEFHSCTFELVDIGIEENKEEQTTLANATLQLSLYSFQGL